MSLLSGRLFAGAPYSGALFASEYAQPTIGIPVGKRRSVSVRSLTAGANVLGSWLQNVDARSAPLFTAVADVRYWAVVKGGTASCLVRNTSKSQAVMASNARTLVRAKYRTH